MAKEKQLIEEWTVKESASKVAVCELHEAKLKTEANQAQEDE